MVLSSTPTNRDRAQAFAIIAVGTVLSIAGTDLVLPAIPMLPNAIGGTLASAQFVLAAYTGGAALGLLLFGELGNRFDQRSVLVWSLLGYTVTSALAGASGSMTALIGLRFLQGAAGSAAAVFAPGMLRALYGEKDAVAALGRIGSIEALAPAFAPVVGLWLLYFFGWRASFQATSALAFALAGVILVNRRTLPTVVARPDVGGYGRLLANARFVRLGLGHALTLGAILVFVFGVPTVFVTALGGSLIDFIVLQISGITVFITAASLTARLVRRFGANRIILTGSLVSATGGGSMLLYALFGGTNTIFVTLIFLLLNVGFGLRGPPGFHQAVVAADDDSRGAALVVLAILVIPAVGTAIVAPFIANGLIPLAIAAAGLSIIALLLACANASDEAEPE